MDKAPSFASTRLYTLLSARAVRAALVSQKGYCEATLPSLETIRVRLNRLGYTLRSVQKTLPKKITETDAIFEELTTRHAAARTDATVLRLSLDTKAAVKIGTFARGGKTRAYLQAADYDFAANETLTLFRIFLPELDEVYFYVSPSHVTADFMVDCVQHFWDDYRYPFPQVTTLLLNLDNGPENHSRHTQFMARLTALADSTALMLQLACSSPYHSKYNPVERVWGVLEQHWNGHLLESRQSVVQLAPP